MCECYIYVCLSDIGVFRLRLFRTICVRFSVTCRRFYKQPGHPQHKLSKKGGRFSKQKSMETWDPADPKGLNTKQPIRDYTEV